MLNLDEWATRWRIPPEAMAELANGSAHTTPQFMGRSEAAIQDVVRLEASRRGGRLWRNNVGVLTDERGVPVRYGLANDSPAVNKVLKSSDLIGVMPVLITPAMVGRVFGMFTAREVKAGDWKWRGSDREVAQLNFITLVNQLGGNAMFVNGEGSL